MAEPKPLGFIYLPQASLAFHPTPVWAVAPSTPRCPLRSLSTASDLTPFLVLSAYRAVRCRAWMLLFHSSLPKGPTTGDTQRTMPPAPSSSTILSSQVHPPPRLWTDCCYRPATPLFPQRSPQSSLCTPLPERPFPPSKENNRPLNSILQKVTVTHFQPMNQGSAVCLGALGSGCLMPQFTTRHGEGSRVVEREGTATPQTGPSHQPWGPTERQRPHQQVHTAF